MQRQPGFLLLIVVAGTVATVGCGSAATDPQDVVERWSRAINAGNDEAAADLFADGAIVSQGGENRRLADSAEARSFNASLPCGGKLVAQTTDGDDVTATFTLTRRPEHMCDGTGETAVAVFRIRDGRILSWRQIPAMPADAEFS